MTIDIIKFLIEDKDILLRENGRFHFHPSSDEIIEVANRKDVISFDLGEPIFNILHKSFNWYATLAVDELREYLDVRFDSVDKDFKTEIDNDFKIEILKEKLKKDVEKFDEFTYTNFNCACALSEATRFWEIFIENDHLLKIIEFIKFYPWYSGIPKIWPQKENDYHLLENYFISDGLKKAYEGMGLSKRIRYIQKKIEFFKSNKTEVDRTLNQVLGEKRLPVNECSLDKAAIAMLVFYRDIDRSKTLNYIDDILKEIDFKSKDEKSKRKYIGKVLNYCNKFPTEKEILDVGIGKHPNKRTIRINQINSLLPFLTNYTKGYELAVSHLEKLSN